MSIHRVALIFDDRLRPETTGVYCRRALAELVEVVHFHPDQRDQISNTGFDLYLTIDDDTNHRLPANLRPLAHWAIDTHLDFASRVERARPCDLVWAAQRDGAERLRAAGIESATNAESAVLLGVSRAETVPSLTRCFGAWLATDGGVGEQLSRLHEELDMPEMPEQT